MGERDHELRRRDFIKKAAVAGGVVWASPVIQSVTTAASTAGTPGPTECNADNSFVNCGQTTWLEGCQSNIRCFCVGLVDGTFACVQHDAVCGNPGCSSNSDCPAGEVCLVGTQCCGVTVCRPLCASAGADRAAAPLFDPVLAR
jgi:hypothetical protein